MFVVRGNRQKADYREGFLAAIKATQSLYKQYVGDDKPLRYLLTYKLSQDHLELFFGAIRAHGGSNNNPTVREFIACFKRMTMRHDIKTMTGGVTPQDETTVLQSAVIISNMQEAVEDDTKDIMMARRYQLISEDDDMNLEEVPDLPDLSIYRESAVGYIAGFVTRMVRRTISCPDCQNALSVKTVDGSQPSHGLILQKDKGGLTKPSPSVIHICTDTEKLLQKLLFLNEQRPPPGEGFPGALALSVLERCGDHVFNTLNDHMLDTEPESNHVFALIKAVPWAYVKIRMHHLVKQYNAALTGKYIRKKMDKLVLFKNQ